MDKAIGNKSGVAGSYFQGKRLTDLEYVDDICSISRSVEDMEKNLHKI